MWFEARYLLNVARSEESHKCGLENEILYMWSEVRNLINLDRSTNSYNCGAEYEITYMR